MKTALISFVLALVAPTLAHADVCPQTWNDLTVVIHLDPPLVWELGPTAPLPQGFTFDYAAVSPQVAAEADTATSRRLLYTALEVNRTHGRITCEQMRAVMTLAARHPYARLSTWQAEAEAFWRIYPLGMSAQLSLPLQTIRQYTFTGDYPAQDVADMVEALGG